MSEESISSACFFETSFTFIAIKVCNAGLSIYNFMLSSGYITSKSVSSCKIENLKFYSSAHNLKIIFKLYMISGKLPINSLLVLSVQDTVSYSFVESIQKKVDFVTSILMFPATADVLLTTAAYCSSTKDHSPHSEVSDPLWQTHHLKERKRSK